MSPAPLICPICWRLEGRRVPVERHGSTYWHGQGQRARGCGVHTWKEAPEQPKEETQP